MIFTSKATFNPGKPAVTRTVVEFPAVEPTITLTLTPREAAVVMGLIGPTRGAAGSPLYESLSSLAEEGAFKAPKLVPYSTPIGDINTDIDL